MDYGLSTMDYGLQTMDYRLKLAIQKSGRLSDKSKKLVNECGIKVKEGKNKLIAPSTNFELDLFYLRDDDIPKYVEDGTADIGILGENVLLEKQSDVNTVIQLGFSKCRLSLAIPKAETYTDSSYFQGKKVATSYPVILSKYLNDKGVQADIHEISGSVEIAPGIGLAEGVCDIVSSGSTLFSNGLKEVEIVMQSQAVLISNKTMSAEKQAILDKLLFRIEAVRRAENSKYILLNAPENKVDDIIKALPGMRSPTVLPLAQKGWVSIHSVLNEGEFWEKIDQLRAAGAEGILVVPIEKMIY